MTTTALVWFRRDLRLDDNPALAYAIEHHDHVIPVFLFGYESGRWAPGAATRSWLHHSLHALNEQLEQRGSRLIIRQCEDAAAELQDLIDQAGVDAVYWNRLYEPESIARDSDIKKALLQRELEVRSFNGSLLFEPWEIETGGATPYRVFTPFWKACLAHGLPSSYQAATENMSSVEDTVSAVTLDELNLLPDIPWDEGFYADCQPGESGAQSVLQDFLDTSVEHYVAERDFPSLQSTSRLSTCLHFGEISPRRIIAATQQLKDERPAIADAIAAFEREVGWREFAHHILYNYPHTTEAPMNDKFIEFPWHDDDESLQAWQQGRTGIPLVDAGMRELWTTGIMHNRVRMVVASLLTKNLLIPWQRGADWFWDTLIDADLANNSMGWQWTAGSGADAAPYFRIFNPLSQSRKFDADGDYIRRWVPEVAELPNKHIHAPWEAPSDVLEQAGVYSQHDYPQPIVDLRESRQRALDAYEIIKQKA